MRLRISIALLLIACIGSLELYRQAGVTRAAVQGLPIDTTPKILSLDSLPESPKELLVKVKPDINAKEVFSGLNTSYQSIPYLSEKLGIYKIPVDSQEQGQQTLTSLESQSTVEFAEYNAPIIGNQSSNPNDPSFTRQWGLTNSINSTITIDILKAWEISEGNGVTVAILDTGINGLHEDLEGQVLEGMNFVTYTKGEPTPSAINPKSIPAGSNSDDNGHGTLISGVIGAIKNNSKGISGIAPKSKLIPVKILDFEQIGASDRAAAAIVWVADQPQVRVINLSLGAEQQSKTLKLAIQYAASKDISIVGSSGNDNKNLVLYPAAHDEVIAVGAINQQGARASETDWGTGKGSNYGQKLQIMAPGSGIFSTMWDSNNTTNAYEAFSGTSAAAPFVSGILALIRSADPSLTYKQSMKRIELSALPLQNQQGRTEETGFGLVQAGKAISIDKQAPIISLTPLQEADVASYPYFSLIARDDVVTTNISSFVTNETTSNIREIQLVMDDKPVIIITPTDKKTSVMTAYYQYPTALSNGEHKVAVKAIDTSNNQGTEQTLSFNVSQAVPTFSIANLTPNPNSNTYNVSIRVVDTSSFKQKSGSTAVEVPLANVLVREKSTNLSQKTDEKGIAIFPLKQGKYTFTAEYDGRNKELTLQVPETQQGQITFALEEQPKANPTSKTPASKTPTTNKPTNQKNTKAPNSGMESLPFIGIISISSLAGYGLTRRKSGKK